MQVTLQVRVTGSVFARVSEVIECVDSAMGCLASVHKSTGDTLSCVYMAHCNWAANNNVLGSLSSLCCCWFERNLVSVVYCINGDCLIIKSNHVGRHIYS